MFLIVLTVPAAIPFAWCVSFFEWTWRPYNQLTIIQPNMRSRNEVQVSVESGLRFQRQN